MALLHAISLALHSVNVSAKRAWPLCSAALVMGCAAMPMAPGHGEGRVANLNLVYLETNQFLWADAKQREHLACANGTAVVCTEGISRLSLANCGCLQGAR